MHSRCIRSNHANTQITSNWHVVTHQRKWRWFYRALSFTVNVCHRVRNVFDVNQHCISACRIWICDILKCTLCHNYLVFAMKAVKFAAISECSHAAASYLKYIYFTIIKNGITSWQTSHTVQWISCDKQRRSARQCPTTLLLPVDGWMQLYSSWKSSAHRRKCCKRQTYNVMLVGIHDMTWRIVVRHEANVLRVGNSITWLTSRQIVVKW